MLIDWEFVGIAMMNAKGVSGKPFGIDISVDRSLHIARFRYHLTPRRFISFLSLSIFFSSSSIPSFNSSLLKIAKLFSMCVGFPVMPNCSLANL
jgi:hypothetical protein